MDPSGHEDRVCGYSKQMSCLEAAGPWSPVLLNPRGSEGCRLEMRALAVAQVDRAWEVRATPQVTKVRQRCQNGLPPA